VHLSLGKMFVEGSLHSEVCCTCKVVILAKLRTVQYNMLLLHINREFFLTHVLQSRTKLKCPCAYALC